VLHFQKTFVGLVLVVDQAQGDVGVLCDHRAVKTDCGPGYRPELSFPRTRGSTGEIHGGSQGPEMTAESAITNTIESETKFFSKLWNQKI
jgi:hypothetical protein